MFLNPNPLPRLQAISQGSTQKEQVDFVRHALVLGCRWVQFRFKDQPEQVLRNTGSQIQELCKVCGATLIVNDHIWLAEELNADGLHLGLTDESIPAARKRLGPGKLIGGTANTFGDVQRRADEGADYIGLGPYRFTTTKAKLSPILDLEGYRQILDQMAAGGLQIPVFAIGGIEAADFEALAQTGIYGVAVSGMLKALSPAGLQDLEAQLFNFQTKTNT